MLKFFGHNFKLTQSHTSMYTLAYLTDLVKQNIFQVPLTVNRLMKMCFYTKDRAMQRWILHIISPNDTMF